MRNVDDTHSSVGHNICHYVKKSPITYLFAPSRPRKGCQQVFNKHGDELVGALDAREGSTGGAVGRSS